MEPFDSPSPKNDDWKNDNNEKWQKGKVKGLE